MNALERAAIERDSRVNEKLIDASVYTPEYRRAREILREFAQTIG